MQPTLKDCASIHLQCVISVDNKTEEENCQVVPLSIAIDLERANVAVEEPEVVAVGAEVLLQVKDNKFLAMDTL